METNGYTRRLEQFLFHYAFASHKLDRPPLIVNEKDGSILVWIPPDVFEMGGGRDPFQMYDAVEHWVHLDGYYLGVHCITNRQYQRFVEATGHLPPNNDIWQRRTMADSSVINVSWEDAQAYCTWAGLALPTEAQWERGARGPGNLLYPWGNDWDTNKCENFNSNHILALPVFAYPQGASGFGTLNQSGHVCEWCRDWYDKDYYRNVPARNPAGPPTGSRRINRGGCWSDRCPRDFLATYRYSTDPADRNRSIGFRPCLP